MIIVSIFNLKKNFQIEILFNKTVKMEIDKILEPCEIDRMCDLGYVIFEYSDCHGTVEYSDKFKEYLNLIAEINPKLNGDYVTAKLIKFLGNEAFVRCLRSNFCFIKSDFYDGLAVHEYDGKEKPYFDFARYIDNSIQKILNLEIGDSEKILKIKELYSIDRKKILIGRSDLKKFLSD